MLIEFLSKSDILKCRGIDSHFPQYSTVTREYTRHQNVSNLNALNIHPFIIQLMHNVKYVELIKIY